MLTSCIGAAYVRPGHAVVAFLITAAAGVACIGDLEAPDDAEPMAAPAPDARVPGAPADAPPPSPPDARVVEPMPNEQGDPIPLRVTGTGTLGLKLRSGPGVEYPILATIPEGCLVTPTGPPEAGWLPVDFRSSDGWAFGLYLSNSPGPDCGF